jgi:hypothetical protein
MIATEELVDILRNDKEQEAQMRRRPIYINFFGLSGCSLNAAIGVPGRWEIRKMLFEQLLFTELLSRHSRIRAILLILAELTERVRTRDRVWVRKIQSIFNTLGIESF